MWLKRKVGFVNKKDSTIVETLHVDGDILDSEVPAQTKSPDCLINFLCLQLVGFFQLIGMSIPA
jgi:hypothetical protein